jgi:hypothetical protein
MEKDDGWWVEAECDWRVKNGNLTEVTSPQNPLGTATRSRPNRRGLARVEVYYKDTAVNLEYLQEEGEIFRKQEKGLSGGPELVAMRTAPRKKYPKR